MSVGCTTISLLRNGLSARPVGLTSQPTLIFARKKLDIEKSEAMWSRFLRRMCRYNDYGALVWRRIAIMLNMLSTQSSEEPAVCIEVWIIIAHCAAMNGPCTNRALTKKAPMPTVPKATEFMAGLPYSF